MPFPMPEPSAGETPSPLAAYEGYGIAGEFAHGVASDGSRTYSYRVTATGIGEYSGRRMFERTLMLSEGDALQSNVLRPGTMPPPDQLQAGLAGVGMRYIEMLIDVVNRGFADIAPTGTRSVSEVRSRIGMTDGALRIREQ